MSTHRRLGRRFEGRGVRPAAFAFFGSRLQTIIYVDGFNLYYRALRGTPYKWLDLKLLAGEALKPENEIVAIKYFTARVSGRNDPGEPARQNAYLRALQTLPEVSVHFGNFLSKTITRPLAKPIVGLPNYVQVLTTEEKGSDVNLASHLIVDAFENKFQVAAVISADTDLLEPVRLLRERGKTVGIVCPANPCPAKLAAVSSFVRHISAAMLAKSQFPNTVTNQHGREIHKPNTWS
jgi:uncharacterized LabA/DUF88 family protein